MALDGAFLYAIAAEIREKALGSRVDRIYQPSREEIVFLLRGKGWSGKLMLSSAADSPRIHFTTAETENPKSPPMFCMLLRKHLSGAKLTAVRQLGLDRVLYLDFDTRNELGDAVTITAAIPISSSSARAGGCWILLSGSISRCPACGRSIPAASTRRLRPRRS